MRKMRFSFQICPFPQFDLQVRAMPTIIRIKNIGDICEVLAQVRYFVKTLVGEARLPSAVDMEKDRQVNPVLLEIEKKINIVVSRQVDLALKKYNSGYLRRRSDTGGKFLACRTNTSTRWELYRWLSLETASALKCMFCFV